MLLKMKGICKSFRLCSGEILGISGLQGSGKSELLKGIFGTYGTSPSGKEVDKEITLASRVFTLTNIEAGGDWIN